jgi:hypothetical protein
MLGDGIHGEKFSGFFHVWKLCKISQETKKDLM